MKYINTINIMGIGYISDKVINNQLLTNKISLGLLEEIVRILARPKILEQIIIIIGIIIIMEIFKKDGDEKEERRKWIIVIMTIGLIMAIISRDLIKIYLYIEVYTMGIYIAIITKKTEEVKRKNIIYFIIGNISSSIILIGIILIYKELGELNINIIERILETNITEGKILYGKILIMSGLIFKIGLFPLHSWILEIYPMISYKILDIVITIPKLVLIGIIYRISIIDNINIKRLLENENIYNINMTLNKIIIIISIISIIIGGMYGILRRIENIRKILSVSSILNIGQIVLIIGLTLNIIPKILESIDLKIERLIEHNYNIYLYVLIYIITIITIIKILNIEKYSNIKETIRYIWIIFILSIIGIAPLAGFYGKYYLILNMLNNKNEIIINSIIIIIIMTIMAGIYYIKIMMSKTILINTTNIETLEKKDINKIKNNKNEYKLIIVSGYLISFIILHFPYLSHFILAISGV